jgi:hypothetical protein
LLRIFNRSEKSGSGGWKSGEATGKRRKQDVAEEKVE